MMEIYNEQIYDLLTITNPKGGKSEAKQESIQFLHNIFEGLAIRQNPISDYFYVQDLHLVPVGNYKDIERQIRIGIQNQSIASTMLLSIRLPRHWPETRPMTPSILASSSHQLHPSPALFPP